jgi:hypothetical protein
VTQSAAVNGGGEVILYEAADGEVRLDVRLEQETVWLTQAQMAELFGRERSVITKHLGNSISGRRTGRKKQCAKFAHCIFGQTGRVLQPGRDRLGRLSSQVPPWNPIPDLGDADA